MEGYIYIGQDQNGLFKIGMTNDYSKRLKQIQNMNPNFGFFCVIPVDDPRGTEKILHSRFASKRMVGEWFQLSADDIQAIIYEYRGIDVPIEEIELHWRNAKGQDLF